VDSLDELLAQADIVSLHCPSAAENRHMIDANRIAAMKPGAIIINTARADLIDYDAMIDALESGHLGGAGLDVFPEEPRVDERIVALPNVIAQPHIGSATIEGREQAGEKVIANIRFWADGHRPPDQVLEGLV
jgi:glyoxylate reductase